jgi:CHAT domain-containing protein
MGSRSRPTGASPPVIGLGRRLQRPSRRAFAAAIAPILIVCIGLGLFMRTRRAVGQAEPSDADPGLMPVIAALGDQRPIEGRLSGGFRYAPMRRVMRGSVAPDNLALLAAAGELRRRMDASPLAEHLHRWGVAFLSLDGDAHYASAVEALERAADAEPGNPAYQNDLGASYLRLAVATDAPAYLAASLEAVERSLALSPRLQEAQFNRALALELLGMNRAATTAWRTYLTGDWSSGWAVEARERIARLAAAPIVVRAPDLPVRPPCVRELFDLYQSGLMSELVTRSAACVPDAADGAATGWVTFLAAVGDYYRGEMQAGESSVRASLAAGGQTPALRGRLLYLLGGIQFARGAFAPALELLDDAQSQFDDIADFDGAISAHQLAAEILRSTGERDDAWTHYVQALRLSDGAPPSVRRHSLLNSVALAGLTQGYPHLAVDALNLAEANASGASEAAELTEVYLNRARGRYQTGNGAAFGDLSAAQNQVSRVADPQIRARLVAEIGLARSEVLVARAPDEAVAAATQALDYYHRLGLVFREATVHLLAARAEAGRGQRSAARAHLLKGVELVGSEQARLERRRLRISHLDRVWDVYRDYAELAIADRDHLDALRMLEKGRAQQSDSPSGDTDVASLARQLAPDTAVVVFFQTHDSLARWAITRRGTSFRQTPMTPVELAREVAALRQAALTRGHSAQLEASAAALGHVLFADLPDGFAAGGRLVIVPDAALGDVPFSCVQWPATGRPVIERVAVAIAPSLQLHIASDRALGNLPEPRGLVAFVPPFNPEARLPALPGARAEAHAITHLYRLAELIEGASATGGRLSEVLQSAAVVHFAGHAVANGTDPWSSRLIVAPSSGDRRGVWLAGTRETDIHAITVLAACSTAVGRVKRGGGVVSIAALLLAAGAPAVIATLADIDDASSSEFFEIVHRELSRGRRPSEAVRTAQLLAARGHWNQWPAVIALGS